MNELLESLASANQPIMVFVGRGETANDHNTLVKLRRYKSNSGYEFVTNIDNPKSIIGNGDSLTFASDFFPESAARQTIGALVSSDDIAHMVTNDGENVYVDAALAFDISLMGGNIVHPATGKSITLAYAGDDEMDDFSGPDDSTENVDITDDTEDMSSEDNWSGDEDEEDAKCATAADDVEDTTTEDEDTTFDSGDGEWTEDDTSTEDETTTEDDGTTEEDTTSEEDITEDDGTYGDDTTDDTMTDDTSEEDTTDDNSSMVDDMNFAEENDGADDSYEDVEISVVDTVDTDKSLQLVATSQNSEELAVFCGGVHIGQLQRTKSTETASALYNNPHNLYAAFKTAFATASRSKEFASLNSFGFTPVKHRFSLTKQAERIIDRLVTASQHKAQIDVDAKVARNRNVVVLASLGIAKGVYGKTNPLVSELASILSAAGVKNAEAVVRRSFAKNADSFTRVVFEKANELMEKDDSYLNGQRDMIRDAGTSGEIVDIPDDINVEDTTTVASPVVLPPSNKEVASITKTGAKLRLFAY